MTVSRSPLAAVSRSVPTTSLPVPWPAPGLALAFAIGEGCLDSTWNANWIRARAHLGFLERHGYVLSEAERQELDEATAEEDAEAETGE